MNSSRIFIALSLPENSAPAIAGAIKQYPQYVQKATPPEKQHLTLLWLGDVVNPKQYLSRLTKSLTQEFVPTVRLTHAGRGVVRDQLWAYAEASPLLLSIREQLIRRLKAMRFKFPLGSIEREFVPHVKIASLFLMSGGVGLPDFPLSLSFTAKEALVMRSELNPQGSQYFIEGRIKLSD